MLAHQNNYVSTTSAFNKFRVFLNATHAAVIFTLLLFTTIAQAGQVSFAWDVCWVLTGIDGSVRHVQYWRPTVTSACWR